MNPCSNVKKNYDFEILRKCLIEEVLKKSKFCDQIEKEMVKPSQDALTQVNLFIFQNVLVDNKNDLIIKYLP